MLCSCHRAHARCQSPLRHLQPLNGLGGKATSAQMEQDAHTLHAVDSDRTGGPAAAAAVAAVAASAAEQSPHEKPWDKEFKQTFVGETVLVERCAKHIAVCFPIFSILTLSIRARGHPASSASMCTCSRCHTCGACCAVPHPAQSSPPAPLPLLWRVCHCSEHAGAGAERPNLVEATSSALGEDISYRNLKEDHDCILADIVRHPHQTSETRACVAAPPCSRCGQCA